ncbi:MAG: Nif3-like dinuclear metal center hexameric protein [Ruminococcus sp.]|nr:Nif3-like dinuclear metal center hexameric protein [Ruminococcus sp.]
MLDKRLKACAELVSGKGIAVDVGTDHAYLAADLILSGKCSKVIASDVKEGPLESARKTVEKYEILDKVDLILSNGLEKIPYENVSDVVIAGMGGETIAEIIANVDCDKYEKIRWILQPMTKIEYLRKKLYDFDLKIVSEKVVEDGDKLYVVICAEYNKDWRYLTEYESIAGFFDESESFAQKYRRKQLERLEKKYIALENAGKLNDAVHINSLIYKLKNGTEIVGINEIYSYLDELYPFNLQEKWDNSGLLVENYYMECSKVLLTLDISYEVICEASCKGTDLIISHHPVIFNPIKRLTPRNPVYSLAEKNIAAICMHTNLDIAQNGTNGVILKMLSEKFSFAKEPEPFEEIGGGHNLGWIVELDEKTFSDNIAIKLKQIFDCEYVRASRIARKKISRIAFCSGSGGSMLEFAKQKNCDALITGDVKHDVWVDANANDIVVFDCGHFHTENPVLWELRRALEERFPQLDVEISERSLDPVIYF